jgi:hypothetical protein
MTNANGNSKDVIYVDVDDEITGIIDKVTSAHAKVVALVLPKRATVFQSIVNMKLLKRRAETAKKHIVLITSETGLMPLAGTVGLYVAATLQSKPEIPEGISAANTISDDIEEKPTPLPEDFDTSKEAATPVGKLAGSDAPSVAQLPDDTLELDNSDLPAGDGSNGKEANVAALAAAGGSGKAAKGKKDRKLKVPNFNRFRMLIVFGALALVLLIVLWIFAFKVLPKADITIHTKTSSINASLSPTLDTNAPALDMSKDVVPAQIQQQQESSNQQVAATGKKNLGQKATGTATLTNCSQDGSSITVPAGTGVSANGLTFITQTSVTLSGSAFDFQGNCKSVNGYSSGSVNITAQQGGSQYNVGDNTPFTVAGQSNVQASGSASGGTDNIVTVVQQSDIDGAKAKLSSNQDTSSIKQQLDQKLQSDGLYPIEATFHAAKPDVSSSVQAGVQADNVTVTETITYTMYGAKKSDLQALLDDQINQQIDTSKQSIQDDGLNQNSFNVPNPGSGSTLDVSLQTTATIGPHIDVASLKTQVAGKKSGDAKNIIKALPGVTDVQVHYSPFWVGTAPSNTSKITITLKK